MTYTIVQASPSSNVGYQGYGAAATLWASKAPEIIIAGPYETGKTLAALHKLHALLCKYPSSQGLMVRKTYKSLVGSAVRTYEGKVLPYPPGDPKCGIVKLGKSKPDWYDYPNGSRLTCGGMDNPAKFLSAEYDFIYVNQAEELMLDDWEKLTGRATGRAGNAPYSQVIGDCNPDVPTHWIMKRDRILLLKSRHEDNPMLFDQDSGELTDQGKRTMKTLNALTGVRYKRGRLGQWAGAEGQVYEFDNTIHLINRFDIPADWPRYRAIDFGYTNPFVCQWWAVDGDGRLYMYRELYETKRLVDTIGKRILELSKGERIHATVADHDAEGRATLAQLGLVTMAADKAVQSGIERVQRRLKPAGDGKPRLFIMRDSLVQLDHELSQSHKPTCTADEFGGYVWPETRANRAADEKPVKTDDHGMDALRYMVMYLDNRLPAFL